jgi:hypothetical protein
MLASAFRRDATLLPPVGRARAQASLAGGGSAAITHIARRRTVLRVTAPQSRHTFRRSFVDEAAKAVVALHDKQTGASAQFLEGFDAAFDWHTGDASP